MDTKNNIYLCILNLSGILFYHLGLMSCENEDPSEVFVPRVGQEAPGICEHSHEAGERTLCAK